jgi:protein-disulfide isomerase
MIRSLVIAAAAAALSAPALANESAAPAQDSSAVATQQLAQLSAEDQARKHLVSQGYTAVSHLEKDADGRWTGTATKDGKIVIVAIKVPAPAPATN